MKMVIEEAAQVLGKHFSQRALLPAEVAPITSFLRELRHRARGTLVLEYQADYETLIINGVPWSLDTFRLFAETKPGTLLRIMERRADGAVVIKQSAEQTETADEAYQRGVNDGLNTPRSCEACDERAAEEDIRRAGEVSGD